MMVYLESPSTDPYYNLAMEQYVFDVLPKSNEYFMLWQNSNAVVVGKHQNTVEEVNAEYVAEHDIKVVRRLSGGGAVYHDMGNLNFTFIKDVKESSELDLRLFCEPVARALQKLGVDAQVNGRNDITVGGKKISGNAQYLKKGRVMHHGTILFDSDLSVVGKALQVTEDKLQSKGARSVRSRVTTVKPHLKQDVTLEEFRTLLKQIIFEGVPMESYHWTDEDLAAIKVLRDSRYATWAWNYGVSPPYSIRKRRRVEGVGSIEAFMEVEKGCIVSLDFRGDFFATEELDGLIARLEGLVLEEDTLRTVLSQVPVERYFTGLTGEELALILAR